LEPLKTPGVDTGMGLERLVATLKGSDNVFATDIFQSLMNKILELKPGLDERVVRILADHLRGSIFLVADGVRPSNKETGYILRRLLRRVLAYQITYDIHSDLFPNAVEFVKNKFGKIYPEVTRTKEILEVLETEKSKFQKAITSGLAQLKKYTNITGKDAFYLYETFGLPFELVKELGGSASALLKKEDFDKEFAKHQTISKAGAIKKFGGHGLILNTGELKAGTDAEVKKVTRLHTATHLLHQALREVLGKEVRQMGSDITALRTRFDFSYDRKLTEGEIGKIEKIVNDKIKENLKVSCEELTKESAEKTGALHFFNGKYPDMVKVYSIGEWSREFCNGPHVERTGEIGEIKILKEESVAAGVRRIRAAIAPS
jgi:alanyl-tRNA synthetase